MHKFFKDRPALIFYLSFSCGILISLFCVLLIVKILSCFGISVSHQKGHYEVVSGGETVGGVNVGGGGIERNKTRHSSRSLPARTSPRVSTSQTGLTWPGVDTPFLKTSNETTTGGPGSLNTLTNDNFDDNDNSDSGTHGAQGGGLGSQNTTV